MFGPFARLVLGNVFPISARHRLQCLDEAGQTSPPALLGVLEHEVRQIRGFARAMRSDLAGDHSGVDVLAPRAPGLFLVIPTQQVEIRGR
jgi:hypothetical protein